MTGVERAPVYPEIPNEEDLPIHIEESVQALELIAEYYEWTARLLGVNSTRPFKAEPAELDIRRQQLADEKTRYFYRRRNIHSLAVMLHATVSDMEGEFAHQSVLDIGCGEGVFGQAIVRNAKADVTFLDTDQEVLDRIPDRMGRKISADGKALPYADESFDKVMSAFSSIFWAETPMDSVQALNEAIRVTAVGGSAFVMPLVADTATKRRQGEFLAEIVSNSPAELRIISGRLERRMSNLKVHSAQEYSVLHSLFKLASEGYIAITWSDYKTTGSYQEQGVQNIQDVDWISAIIDKLKPIPPEVYEDNLAYARQFMPDQSE